MLRAAGFLIPMIALSTSALAQKAEESKSDNIGPWKIEATFKADKLDHCAISRKTDDVVARFIRTSDGLSVVLESANWKLERGKQYSVRMKAASSSWDTELAAEANSVSGPITDKKFREGLLAANTLSVEGAGATIRIPLEEPCRAREAGGVFRKE
jgi:hypothetical protein